MIDIQRFVLTKPIHSVNRRRTVVDGNTENGPNERDGKAVSGAAIAFTECIGRDGNRIES